MIAAFGPAAVEYADGLGALEALVSEVSGLEAALHEAVLRRERGERFYAMVLLDHPGPLLTRLNAGPVLAEIDDYDRRLLVLDELALGRARTADGTPVRDLWVLEPQVVRLMEDFYGLAEAMLVRSYTELARLAEISDRLVRSAERVLVEPRLPPVERVLPEVPGVVVWAPRRPAAELALHAFGLREFIGSVTCVTAGGRPQQPTATFLTPDDPRVDAALAAAACIVCVEPDDPGDAVAFARRGYGVVAPLSAGAHEFAGAVVTWNGTPGRLHHCVATAFGSPAWVRPADPAPPRVPPAPPPPAPQALPLVSVVTPTYNRPDDLRALLAALAAQTYPNLEAVVVNDGGASVASVVHDFPFARLVENERNLGLHAAVAVGLDAARGPLVGVIADDDLFYPDHLERVVFALLRSGAAVAHGAGLWRRTVPAADGSQRTVGINCSHLRGTTTPSEALVTSTMALHQLVVRRAAFDAIGPLRADLSGFCDQEFLLRLAQRFTFAYADAVTSEFRDRPGTLGKGANVVALQRRVYDELHPCPGRPEIARRRERIIHGIAEPFLLWDAPDARTDPDPPGR